MRHIGDAGEDFVIQSLTAQGITAKKNEDKEKRYDYDLLCKYGTLDFTCEVKYDAMSMKTGNIAIETWNTKKDAASGITVTKADLWVIVLIEGGGLQAHACKVSKLREFVAAAKPFKSIKNGGDKNANLLIYKKADILKEFTRIDNLTAEEIGKWVTQIITL